MTLERVELSAYYFCCELGFLEYDLRDASQQCPGINIMGWWVPGALVVCRARGGLPVGFFFCSGVQFCLLLGLCLCFISLLCLDLCVLGDDELLSWGSFMPTKCLCVLIHIWVKGEVGAVGPV